jgi:hypothetical protein
MTTHLKIIDMVRKFQCSGCLHGHEPESCTEYNLNNDGFGSDCDNHRAATFVSGIGRLALGLPKGFNRYGAGPGVEPLVKMRIRLHVDGPPPWDKFNVPVWKMVKDGMLFVRTYVPRINACFVDVVQGVGLDAPGLEHTIDVGQFYDDID